LAGRYVDISLLIGWPESLPGAFLSLQWSLRTIEGHVGQL
jgi:hypothetical protein